MLNLLSAAASSENMSLFETLSHNVIFSIAALILLGLLGGKLVEIIKFPKVTGYILIGILIGPGVFGVLTHDMLDNFTIIRQMAIGFIGYTIGLELKLDKLMKTGKQVTIITLSQAFLTTFLVTLAIVTYLAVTDGDYIWTYALILGAIATATAPGPIVAVVKNFRTKGPVTDVLLPLVALDDAIGIMIFAVMLSLGVSLLSPSGSTSVVHMMLEPVFEIGISFIVGAILGYILYLLVKKFNRDDDKVLLMMTIGIVIAGIGLGQVFHASAILLPMTIGVVLTNLVEESYEKRLTKNTDLFSAPILLGFFTLAGAELDLHVLRLIGVIGIIYIVVRVLGKVVGSYLSAKAVKAPPTVVKYLGFTLIPQAGVAIDMALTAELRFASMPGFEVIGSEIMTIVLAATVIYEVFGLIVVKSALTKAGEIDAGKVGWDTT
jgi:Kef-type K+ transport system membrane component KefB